MLRDTADAVAAKVADNGGVAAPLLRFGIEATTSVAGSPDWDSVVQHADTNEVIEAKSGVISKDDRLALWRRLRREIQSGGDRKIRPVLVIDPTAETPTKWRQVASVAADRLTANDGHETSPAEPRVVRDADNLVDEALCQVCSGVEGEQVVSANAALKVLATFTVEPFAFTELEASVLVGIELLFPDGLSPELSDAVLGWLNRRATAKAAPRRLFTTRELLGEMTILQQCAAYDSGTLSRWKAFWNDLPAVFRRRARTRLGKTGEAIAMERSQPAIASAIDEDQKNLAVLGPGGAGKSALLTEIGRRVQGHGADTFECSADTITEDEVTDLFASLRFRRALLRVRQPERQMYVIVDALDEADINLRTGWAKQLARFGTDPHCTVIVSIRDHAWRVDGISRTQFADWDAVTVQEWSPELVSELLRQQWPEAELSPGLITLVRQPLMLDVFWTTFVEDDGPSAQRSFPDTRHQLLAAFWAERILRSPRHHLPNLQQRLETILARAAADVSGFSNGGEDPQALEVLLSESVILPEGQFEQTFRFRHPLLRDFAMALWCLAAPSDSHVAERWSQIKAGLQRHGALRAILEALGDPQFSADHPHLSRSGIITAILAAHGEAPAHVAQVLGTFAPDAAFDPAMWPATLQDVLPRNFASELVAAARLAGNVEWANPISSWAADAPWIDDSFVDGLLNFVRAIRPRVATEQPGSRVLHLGRIAATKLRQVSEHPRFTHLFESKDRWRKMAAMQEIVPLVPDEQTLSWIEREMPIATCRTRGFLLDKLIYLVATDPQRTAGVYRTAVGLSVNDGYATLDASCWSDNLMEHHAIEWSLAGRDQHRSLLKEFPEAFMPVAFELAEALALQDQYVRNAISANALIDDRPDYSFWREGRDHTAVGRCIRSIQKWSEHLAETDPRLFFSLAAPLFRGGRLLSLHSVYLDITLKRAADIQFFGAFVECLRDGRLYRHVSLIHWLEAGFTQLWQRLAAADRSLIKSNIEALAAGDDDAVLVLRSRFLACLPASDLSAAQQAIAAEQLNEGFRPYPHPRERYRFSDVSPFSDVPYEDHRTQGWPDDFDEQQLRILSHASSRLAGTDTPADVLAEHLPTATAAALQLLPSLLANYPALDDVNRFWVLDALEDLLEKHRSAGDGGADAAPPESLVRHCAELSLTILETAPHGVTDAPERLDTWHRPETVWCHALALADSALVCAPANKDSALQLRFEDVLIGAYQTGDTGVQVAISWSVRPWHWLHSEERRALHDKLVWQTPRNAAVLVSSLAATQNERDKNRTAIYRTLLDRADIDKPEALAKELGELCGRYSMIVFTDIGRSAVADLAREVIDDPTRFSLLKGRDAEVQFLHAFAFGMKEVAQHNWDNLDLVTDYARWSLKIWRRIAPVREKRQESEGIVLFAMHWLEATDPETRDIDKLRVWWQQLLPLIYAVAQEGKRPDCFTLFSNLQDPKMYHVVQAQELLESVELLLRRLTQELKSGGVHLDEVDHEGDDYNSWREVLKNAAESLENGRVAGLLRNDWQREKSRSLLAVMAALPFDVETARKGLYQLHNESI